MKKRCMVFAAVLMAVAASVFFFHAPSHARGETWAVYLYLCGSDLETSFGAATSDLVEAAQVWLPPNVKHVVQTGGALEWHNDLVG